MSAPQQTSVAGRPVVSLSLAVNYALGGLRPASYHVFNQVCHALAAVVLFLLVRDVTRERLGPHARTAAFAAALLWLVHPLQSETVAYVVQRTELLMALFYLLTLWCAWRGFVAPRGRHVWLAGAVVACALGMASKEVMVSAPLCVLLMDRALAAGSFGEALRKRPRFYAALAATWLILIVLVLPGPRSRSAGFGAGMSPWHYLLSQAEVLVYYLRLIVWPHPLLVSYDWPVAQSVADVWPQALVILALLAVTAWALWRRPVVGWLAATCFMVLAPTSSFVPITTELVAERRMHLVLAPLFAMAVFAIARRLRARVWMPAMVAIAVIWATVAFVRAGEFNDPLALWRQVLAHYPDHRQALDGIGIYYMQREDYAEAMPYFARVVELYPDKYGPRVNYGIALTKLGRADEGEKQFEKAAEQKPDRPEAYYNLAWIYVRRGEDERAAELFERALRCHSESYSAWYELGRTRQRLGQYDMAIEAYRQAMKRNPRSAKLHNDLAIALALDGRTAEAEQQFLRALETDPGFEEARHNLNRLREHQSQ